jgi:hypothetical protein
MKIYVISSVLGYFWFSKPPVQLVGPRTFLKIFPSHVLTKILSFLVVDIFRIDTWQVISKQFCVF